MNRPDYRNWSYLIKEHISRGSPREALLLFNRIRSKGYYFSGIIPSIFKACASVLLIETGKALHGESIKTGIDFDIMVATSMVGMYSKCGIMGDACKLFDSMPERNLVTWNSLINGFLRNENVDSAFKFFNQMPERSEVSWIEMIHGYATLGDTVKARIFFERVPDELKTVRTWTAMVEGYTSNGEMEAARRLFEEMPKRNFYVWSSMISGYCKQGKVDEARSIFDRIPARNLVNWNSLISGYAQNGYGDEALVLFEKMQAEGFEPDEVTVASALSACAQLCRLDYGKGIHCLIREKGMKLNQFVLNALVDMYAKCGDLITARLIFEEIKPKNNACWNSMISGFAIHGRTKEALQFFKIMEENSTEKPDSITFLSILSACAHGGFIDEGLHIFSKMEKHGLVPSEKHYGCLVDLLGRAGRLREAYDLLKGMSVEPNSTVWGALFGACQIHLDVEMVKRAMDSNENMVYGHHNLLVSNVYAASERWQKAEMLRTDMINKKIQKVPGCSSVW